MSDVLQSTMTNRPFRRTFHGLAIVAASVPITAVTATAEPVNLPKPFDAYFFVSRAHADCLLSLHPDERLAEPTFVIAGTDTLLLPLDRLCGDDDRPATDVIADLDGAIRAEGATRAEADVELLDDGAIVTMDAVGREGQANVERTASLPEIRPPDTSSNDRVSMVVFRRRDLECLSAEKVLDWTDGMVAVPKAPCDE